MGADTQFPVKDMAIRRVDLQGSMLTGQARAAAEGRETARLRRRFSFVLQQALSQRTRHHLCRQGVLSMAPHGPLLAVEPDWSTAPLGPGAQASPPGSRLADPDESEVPPLPAESGGAQAE